MLIWNEIPQESVPDLDRVVPWGIAMIALNSPYFQTILRVQPYHTALRMRETSACLIFHLTKPVCPDKSYTFLLSLVTLGFVFIVGGDCYWFAGYS